MYQAAEVEIIDFRKVPGNSRNHENTIKQDYITFQLKMEKWQPENGFI